MYPADIVLPMKEELTDNGFLDLHSVELIDQHLAKEGTMLLVINSVCGCSAGSARPAALISVQKSEKKPDYLATSFAGFDIEAINHLRNKYLLPYPPSSPAIALFKDGKLVHFIERHQIEGRTADMIATNLIEKYSEYC